MDNLPSMRQARVVTRVSNHLKSRPPAWLQWLLGLVLALAVGIPAPAAISCESSANPSSRDCSVLLIHSYHPGLEWAKVLTEHFSASLSDEPQIRIDSEYLDAKRHPSLKHADAFLRLLREKYAATQPHVLVISDDPAFDLLWPVRNELFPDVPVVFMGLNGRRDGLLNGTKDVTGIFELHSTERTVDIALKLTGASGIIVINDTSETGIANEFELNELIKANPAVEWVIERDLSVKDIDRLAARPRDWPIITMLPLQEDKLGGPMLSQRRSVDVLRQSLPNPLFYDSEWMVGNGLVGGYMLSGADHARQAGELVLAVLSGQSARSLPIRFDTRHQWIFDQRELDRFGWTSEQLPQDANILFAKKDFFERNREIIYPMFWLLSAALLIIGLLSITVSRQRRAESKLREQERRLTAALAATDAGVFEITPEGNYASSRWLTLMDINSQATTEIAQDKWLENVSETSRRDFACALEKLETESEREVIELEIAQSAQSPRRLVNVLITRRSHRPNGTIIGVATDTTATRQLEHEAARRNRLELLGELAGGVAHDFNNFLLVLRFSAQMAKDLDSVSDMRRLVVDIEQAGEKAADVVKQLLAFGKPEPQKDEVVELNSAVNTTEPILRRLLGMRCRLSVNNSTESLGVRIDQPQLERVLSNLVVNAKDAMVAGGTIRVDIETVMADQEERVLLRVTDDGEGMDEATQSRIFEPFYSTKDIDKGTGLGLSTVYSVVKNSGGTIAVRSKPGQGAVFEMTWKREALPSLDAPKVETQYSDVEEKTILLVEDDPRIGPMTQRLLNKAGHNALLAKDGRSGFELFSDQPEAIDLVLSDVVLPEMNGIDMVKAIREVRPNVRVGFISGYADHPSLGGAQLPTDVELLPKPFSRDALTAFVVRALGQARQDEWVLN